MKITNLTRSQQHHSCETEHCGLDPFKICNSKESEDYDADRVATLSISRCLFGTYENCKGLEVKMDLTP